MLKSSNVAVIIPAYKAEAHIEGVLRGIPSWVHRIIVVNDASPDATGERALEFASGNPKCTVLTHETNQGVGGAMVTGFKAVLEDPSVNVVIKMDSDGQMSPDRLSKFLEVLQQQGCDFVKANRFMHLKALQQMPLIRQIGNTGLGFLTKIATGYWSIFDPTNGFFGIRATTLKRLDLEQLASRYYFEISLLGELGMQRATVRDLPTPAVYSDEVSNLSVTRTLFDFPPRLFRTWLRRMVVRDLLWSFSAKTLFLFCGVILGLGGTIFGGVNWLRYGLMDVPAPTGTVVLAALLVTLGFQLCLQFLVLDIQDEPKQPLWSRPTDSLYPPPNANVL